MDVERDAGLLRRRTQGLRSAWIGHDRRLVPLRITEEELDEVGPSRRRFG